MKKALLIIILSIIAAAVILLSTIPIDLTQYRGEIKARIEERINGTVEMDRVYVKFLPHLTIQLKGFKLLYREEPIVKAESAEATLYILPMIFKRLIIKELHLEQPVVVLRRDAEGRLNLEKIRKKKLFHVMLRGLKVRNASITVADNFPKKKMHYELRRTYLYFDIYTDVVTYSGSGVLLPNTPFKLSGEMRKEDSGRLLTGTAFFENLKVSTFLSYIKDELKGVDLSGTLSADLEYQLRGEDPFTGDFVIKGTSSIKELGLEYPALFRKPIHSKAGVANVELTKKKDSLVISVEDGKFNIEDLVILGSVTFKLPQKSISLSLSTTPFMPTHIKRFFREDSFPKGIKSVIEEFKDIKGFIKLNGLTFSSEVKPYLDSLVVDAKLMDMAFMHRRFDYPFSSLNGRLVFRAGNIELENIQGTYGNTYFHRIEGTLTSIKENPRVRLSISADVDTAQLLKEVKKTIPEEPLKSIELSGRAALELQMEGIATEPSSIDFNGSVTLDSVRASYSPLKPLSLVASGTVEFDRTSVRIKGLSASYRDSSLTIEGTIADYKKSPSLDMEVRGLAGYGLTSMYLKEPVLTYPADLKVHIKGSMDSLNISSVVDLSKSGLIYREIIHKDRGYPLLVRSTVRVKKDRLYIKDAAIVSGKSRLNVEGYVKKGHYSLKLHSRSLKVEDIRGIFRHIQTDSPAMGSIYVNLSLKDSPYGTSIDGKVTVKDGLFRSTLFRNSVRDMNLVARFSGKGADVVLKKLYIGKSHLSGKINLLDIRKRIVSFSLVSDFLDTDDFLTIHKKEKTPKGYPVKAKGKLTAKAGRVHRVTFWNLSADVTVDPYSIRFEPVSFTSHGGQVAGLAALYSGLTDRKFKLKFRASRLKLSPLLKDLGVKKEVLTGRFTAVFDIDCKREEPYTRGLNGTIKAVAKDGKLWKFIVLSKIFSVVNIISITDLFEEGLPYKKIRGDFTLKNGVISTDNLVLDSKSLRMSAIGSIDITEKTIDTTLGLHPFVTIDKIISKIPLVGWIITGKDKSTVTMYYEIKGPLKNPHVEPIPIKGLGTQMLGIFQRLLTSPIKVMEPLNREKKRDEKELLEPN